MIYRRLRAVRTALAALKLQALLVTELNHVRYLTGFSGSNGLCVVTPTKQFFLTDGRYKTQALEEVVGFTIIIADQNLFPLLEKRKIISKRANVGIESQYLSVADMSSLKKFLPGRRFILAATILEKITSIKDDGEIAAVRSAARITDKVFMKILKKIRPGLRECDVAADISYYQRKYGAECDAFDPIVASGKRSALPHAKATEKRIRRGEFVTIDFGCRYRGYCSDLTRTIVVGSATSEMKKVYQIVLDAQIKAIEAIRKGVSAREIDRIARKYIKQNGYGRYFIHSLGHGLGIHLHDQLRLSPLSTAVFETGNVVAIEPGIYIPSKWGVRIEDDVLLGERGCRVLTRSPRGLIVL
jgi:Xaa-Pro aminopeptidase